MITTPTFIGPRLLDSWTRGWKAAIDGASAYVEATLAGGVGLKERVIDPYLEREKAAPEIRDTNQRLPGRTASQAGGTQTH